MASQPPLILIVDDVKEARVLLRHILVRLGCRFIEAENGQEAVDLYRQHHPDLILMDISMPVMDGFEACQKIRDFEDSVLVPILIVTSLNDNASIERAYEVGATDFVTKPIQPTVIFHRVSHWLRARRAEQVLARRNSLLERVNQAARAATSSLELPAMLTNLLRVAGEALDATSVCITRYDPHDDSITILAEYRAPIASPAEKESVVGRSDPLSDFQTISAWVRDYRDNHLLVQMDEIDLADKEKEFYTRREVKTALLAPFHTEAMFFGYIEFWDTRQKRTFSPDEIELVQAIANQAAASITNTQLYAALKHSEESLRLYTEELETRNRELDNYNHTIAHDLKNPLTMILNYAAIVEEEATSLSETTKVYLQRIQQSSRQMAAMIEQLLLLAGLRHASETVKTIDMHALIDIALLHFEPQLAEKNIRIERLEPLPMVMGHDVWVQEILENLISNAIKYMGETNAEPRITIFAMPQEPFVRYHVQDNGIGIPSDQKERLFEMFTRLKHISADGHGLGLSIVKGLTAKMDGEVGVESVVGEGSTFWFTLPIVQQPH